MSRCISFFEPMDYINLRLIVDSLMTQSTIFLYFLTDKISEIPRSTTTASSVRLVGHRPRKVA